MLKFFCISRGNGPDFALLNKTEGQPRWFFETVEDVLVLKYPEMLGTEKQLDTLQDSLTSSVSSQSAMN
jgi:hypothetical protein